MQEIFFVTGNRNKFEEVRSMMEKHGIKLLQTDVDIIEHRYPTVREVSIAKALSAAKLINKPLIVEDTGIYFKGFKKFPGTNAKVVFEGIGISGVMKLLEDRERGATFVTAVAFVRPGMQPIAFVGECKGSIAGKPSEVIDFAYDTIFVPKGESRTFSEMGKGEKEAYSHRNKAIEEFIKWFKSEGKTDIKA